MERYRIEALVGEARDVLEARCKDGTVEKTMRSKMSGFGAAVIMGGILPAIAYYSKNEKGILELLQDLYLRVHKDAPKGKDLFGIVNACDPRGRAEISEELLAMSVSLKLAMNTFRLVDGKE